MTNECQLWAAQCVRNYSLAGPVLEIGSFDVCGNPRHHFANRERFPSYLGIDIRPGPGVDLIMSGNALDLPDESIGVVVNMESLEHDFYFWRTFDEMYRVTRRGGHVLITTRSWNGFGPHDYPSDYWRFMEDGIIRLFTNAGFRCLETAYGERSSAVYGLAVK
jgi:SAM-dependent methyltransferase